MNQFEDWHRWVADCLGVDGRKGVADRGRSQ